MLVPLVDMLNHAGKAAASGWTACFGRLACTAVCCLLLACLSAGAGLLDAAAAGSELLDVAAARGELLCDVSACVQLPLPSACVPGCSDCSCFLLLPCCR